MHASFLTFINEQRLFKKKDKLLLAVSGGVDSMVLMHLLKAHHFTFSVAHCNFCLRKNDADEDENFVKNYCEKHQIPFFTKRFATSQFAEKQGISTQMAARELRYTWFEELRIQEKFNYLLTAHHLNDNLETVLLNFTKGTGIAGLKGISPKRDWVVRPLLFAKKTEIIAFATQNNLKWREDTSNASNKYQRNLLRNEVIPLLKNINPTLEETFLRTVERLTAVSKIYEKQLADFQETVFIHEADCLRISLETLDAWEHKLLFLEDSLRPFGFTYQQTQQLLTMCLDKKSGGKLETETHILFKDRTHLFLVERQLLLPIDAQKITDKVQVLNQEISVEKTGKYPSAELLKNSAFAFLDAEKITFPLFVRTWQQGDKFVPYGMKGKKLLSDFFIDKKITVFRKQMQLVVTTANNDIVWVVGHRIDDRFAISEHTTAFLELKTNYF
jgi:tRNA(Ile)-lysidine synthase